MGIAAAASAGTSLMIFNLPIKEYCKGLDMSRPRHIALRAKHSV